MPDYFAHLQFGAEVLERLDASLAETLRAERAAFDVGCYGPDPLFFYHPLTRNAARLAGFRTHEEPFRPAAERLRRAVREGLPQARGYAAGFLCHFALDSACHGYVEAKAAEGRATHSAMEAEFDRMLKERAGLDPLHVTGLPGEACPEGLWATAAYAYEGVEPKEFRKGLKLFLRAGRLQTLAAGTRCQRAMDWTARHSAHCASAKGVILAKGHNPLCSESTAELFRRYRRALEHTPQQLEEFFHAVELDAPLGAWCDRNFSGRSAQECCPEEEGVPSAAL